MKQFIISTLLIALIFLAALILKNISTPSAPPRSFAVQDVTAATPQGRLLLGQRLNINDATAVELEQLQGIGPSLAKRIVEYRLANGRFASVDELVRVKGIGEKMMKKMRAEVRVGD